MINDRVKNLIEYISNGNKRAFSSKIGVSATVIENIVGTRQGNPGYPVLEKIVFAIANLNADWLLTGRGEMIHNTSNSVLEAPTIQIEGPAESSIFHILYKEKDAIIKEKDAKIEAQAKEIGKLEAEVEGLEEENKKMLETLKSIPKHAPVSSVESA